MCESKVMPQALDLEGLIIDLHFKEIKNINLKVTPPAGKVSISAPRGTSLQKITLFASSHLDWIKQKQEVFSQARRQAPPTYQENENHYLWGKAYQLVIQQINKTPQIQIQDNKLILNVRSITEKTCEELLYSLYLEEIRQKAEPLIEKWQALMGLKVKRVSIQKMKTRWGSCNPQSAHIRLNTELAKKDLACLEYVIVHELVHLFVPNHGPEFKKLMNKFMPNWKQHRNLLKANH